jgi:hypothetical protein
MEWPPTVGEVLVRQEIHDFLGGQRFGGISTPKQFPYVFLFTDPATGAKFGYDKFEGPTEGGGYAYTGEGQSGDQEFTGGNKAILSAEESAKTILLFRAQSPKAVYVGEFFLGDPGYFFRHAPGLDGAGRQVIVFNLVPLKGSPELMAKTIGRPESVVVENWSPPSFDSYSAHTLPVADDAIQASREEMELQAKFGIWLESRGLLVRKMSIRTNGSTISPDLFNETENEVIEAKKSPAREYLRTAIGQVLDYQYCAQKFSDLSLSCAILLPSAPVLEQIELCTSLGIKIYVPEGDGFSVL